MWTGWCLVKQNYADSNYKVYNMHKMLVAMHAWHVMEMAAGIRNQGQGCRLKLNQYYS